MLLLSLALPCPSQAEDLCMGQAEGLGAPQLLGTLGHVDLTEGQVGDGQNILWCKDLPSANKGGSKIWLCVTLPSLGNFG